MVANCSVQYFGRCLESLLPHGRSFRRRYSEFWSEIPRAVIRDKLGEPIPDTAVFTGESSKERLLPHRTSNIEVIDRLSLKPFGLGSRMLRHNILPLEYMHCTTNSDC